MTKDRRGGGKENKSAKSNKKKKKKKLNQLSLFIHQNVCQKRANENKESYF